MNQAPHDRQALAGSLTVVVAAAGGQAAAYQLARAIARGAGAGTLVDLGSEPVAEGASEPNQPTLADVVGGACTLQDACVAAADAPELMVLRGGSLAPEQSLGGTVVDACSALCLRGPVLAVVPAAQVQLLPELFGMADAAVFACGCSLETVLELRRTQQALYAQLPARCFALVEGGDAAGPQLRSEQVEAWLRPLPVCSRVDDVLSLLLAQPAPGAREGSARLARERLLAMKRRDAQQEPAPPPGAVRPAPLAEPGRGQVVSADQHPTVQAAAPGAPGDGPAAIADAVLERARAFFEDRRRLAALQAEVERLSHRLAAESQALQKAFEL